MKRWCIKENNLIFKIYCNSYEECKEKYPNCIIEECCDYEYLKTIDEILEASKLQGLDYKGRKIYKLDIDGGYVYFRVMEQDGFKLDGVQYQQWNNRRFSNPITWTMCGIEEFYNKFFNNGKMEFQIYSFRKYGEPKLKKPKELSKMKANFSVDFIPKKCRCECFIKDNDLWIKHRDFFSEEMEYEDCDFGTPLEYRCKKYLDKDKSQKFIYSDSWGSIILRNEAWIIFRNIVTKSKLTNEHHLTYEMLDIFSKYHRVDNTYFIGTDWEFFFNRVSEELYKQL